MLGYTQAIEDEYWSYADRIAVETKLQIENMDEKAKEAEWKKSIEDIGKKHTCSARFFLMAYLFEKSENVSLANETYDICYKDVNYTFHTVTPQYSFELPEEERDRYIKIFTQMSSDNHNDEANNWKPLFWKAMLRNKKVDMLTRQEGFKIAHGLKFNLPQAEKFLLTVLENDGFCYTHSEDIIETFCFLYEPANNYYVAEKLKQLYSEKTKDIPKKTVAEKPEKYTQMISRSIPDKLKSWMNGSREEEVLEKFMDWMVSESPVLDVPSQSAFKYYRSLAEYAYTLTINENLEFTEDDFVEAIQDNCLDIDLEQALATDVDIYTIANTLCNFAVNEFDNPNKREASLVWRYITVDEKGRIVARAIGERIPLLLEGKEEVEKADMLFLLWYTCGIFWHMADNMDGDVIYDRIAGFWSLAEEFLDKSMLPQFYVPHLLERSFLNAICSQDLSDNYPFEVYEVMCEVVSEKKTRHRESKVDEKSSRKDRLALRKKIEEEYSLGKIDLEGLGEKLLPHFLENAYIHGQYVFAKEGIYFVDGKSTMKDPNEKIAVAYANSSTGNRFDVDASNYRDEVMEESRVYFLYGLTLYLIEHSANVFHDCDFRVNYKKNATLTIIKLKK